MDIKEEDLKFTSPETGKEVKIFIVDKFNVNIKSSQLKNTIQSFPNSFVYIEKDGFGKARINKNTYSLFWQKLKEGNIKSHKQVLQLYRDLQNK